MYVDNKLKWDKHTDVVYKKANSRLFMFKAVRSRNPFLLTNLYKVYVRFVIVLLQLFIILIGKKQKLMAN